MSKNPFISVIIGSNRPFLWKNVWDHINKNIGDIEIEIIFIGPESSDFILPHNVRHIQTGNIKPPQCYEIGLRNASGKMFLLWPDDIEYRNGGIFQIYHRYLELCEQLGHNKVIVMPSFCGLTSSTLTYNKIVDGPIASLNSALVDRELISQIGRIDKRFVGVYWDCDLAMRLNEIGVYMEKYKEVQVIEITPPGAKYLLHRICKPHDKKVLDSFWTRFSKEIKTPLPEDAYCYMKDKRWVVTKKRQKDVMFFDDENIMTETQGEKKFGGLEWD